ncbi:helix-turn-helix domain-containing protein [Micromonospora sp. WMMD1076]|uniref:helix-turn-helix domain-containing protein n=1 Tax=Micromonospora sp. WMMD1076 TaxID=3016103 RepID=UPI00249B4D7E|nr:helix-turn-helix domain-containing protein [Micromonospora sp. WMMD1076]WFF08072.1 helix-turn-helix domain-containing protein [Micromonospora sp. WMMD1076]
MDSPTEQELLTATFDQFTELITDDDMKVNRRAFEDGDAGHDAMWDIQAANYHCTLIVQAFRRFIPRDVDRVLGGNHRLMRRVVREPIVVVAPWLSPRSREVLRERDINYIDLTGNVLVRIPRPAIHIRLDGAQQDPNPPAKPPVRLKGPGSNALVRVLTDFAPPYRLVDLAAASGLSNAYVSRTLNALVDDRLVERDPRSKAVTSVDWRELLRARAQHYNLLKSNRSQTYIARTGVPSLLRRLSNDDQAVITGSYAANHYVQIAAPTQLALYVPDIAAAASRLELMPAQQGANVILLTAADASQLARSRMAEDGTFHVGLSQLVLDCLAGNGRLPEEGEALLDWMAGDPVAWRQDHLPQPM